MKVCDGGEDHVQKWMGQGRMHEMKNLMIEVEDPFHPTKIKESRLKVQTRGTKVSLVLGYGTIFFMDKASWLGLLIGFGAILVGNMIEGGHVSSLMQFTAGLIVLGGTIGAVMISSSEKDLKKGIQLFKSAFRSDQSSTAERSLGEIVEGARTARRENLLALQNTRFSDPFVGRMVRNVLDGIDLQLVREIGEAEIDREEEEHLNAVKVWNDAGGFSPTIGIIGAVLGLIHVMGNLSDTSKLGAGIAVAFVATVYGVSFANLIFLPVANKLKRRALYKSQEKRALLEGVLMINTNLNPIIIEQKMKASLHQSESA